MIKNYSHIRSTQILYIKKESTTYFSSNIILINLKLKVQCKIKIIAFENHTQKEVKKKKILRATLK